VLHLLCVAQALEWLDGNYWQEQEDSLTEMTDRMRSHLTRYVELKGNRTVAQVPHAPGSQASTLHYYYYYSYYFIFIYFYLLPKAMTNRTDPQSIA
jgi:hypothetical protein